MLLLDVVVQHCVKERHSRKHRWILWEIHAEVHKRMPYRRQKGDVCLAVGASFTLKFKFDRDGLLGISLNGRMTPTRNILRHHCCRNILHSLSYLLCAEDHISFHTCCTMTTQADEQNGEPKGEQNGEKKKARHCSFIGSLLVTTAKIQREMRGRRYKVCM